MYGGFTLLWILRELSDLVPQQLLGGMAHSDQLGQNLRKCSELQGCWRGRNKLRTGTLTVTVFLMFVFLFFLCEWHSNWELKSRGSAKAYNKRTKTN